jgi:hypothetical protein
MIYVACRPGSDRSDELKAFHRDFEIVRTVPTIELKGPCCCLLISAWADRQPEAAEYFETHCSEYEWTRAECGAGIPDDNNGKQLHAFNLRFCYAYASSCMVCCGIFSSDLFWVLGEEGTNRWQKEDQEWVRLAPLSFSKHLLLDFLKDESKNDFGFNDMVNRKIWNRKTAVWVHNNNRMQLLQYGAAMRLLGVQRYILPSCSNVLDVMGEEMPTAIQDGDVAAKTKWVRDSTKQWRLTFIGLLNKNPKAAAGNPGDTDQAWSSLENLHSWLRSYHCLTPYPPDQDQLVEVIWQMMKVPASRQEIKRLMYCSCSDYMHYICCRHVLLFHFHWKQVQFPETLLRMSDIEQVNKAQKDNTRGRKAWQIPKNAALQRE